MRIAIYAPTYRQAAELAATMNLSLRHWIYEGSGPRALGTWADVGSVMDAYQIQNSPEWWPPYDH
jgi:hypothetical protein